MAEELNREREGLQVAKLFLDYCFNVSDMIPANSPENIIKNLKEYGLKMCDDCGGAMCSDNCPVSKYIDDMSKWLKGERTVFATDRTKQRNCDVGTVAEQMKRFEAYCSAHGPCESCPLDRPRVTPSCGVHWSQMPYESMEEQL